MRRLLVWAAVAQLCTLATPPGVLAHIPLYGVGTQTRFVFKEDKVLVTFDLSYDSVWAQGEMVRADKDRSSSVDEAEADAYLKSQWEERIASRIEAFVDGKKAHLSKVAERHESLVGEIFPTPFSLFYELEVAIPAGEGRPLATHTFDFEDTAVAGETKALPRFVVPYQGHGRTEGVRFLPEFLAPQPVGLDTDGYWLEGRKLSLRFGFEGGGAARETAGGGDPGGEGLEAPEGSPGGAEKAAPPAPEPEPEPPAPAPERAAPLVDETDWIHRAFRDFGTSGWAALVWVLVATLYGAGHALTPGHGKTMVAAYLIGTKGTIRDAAILGIATTVTHTGSVFIFGGSIFLILNATTRFSEGHVRNMIIVGTQLVSGLLLLALGITLFARRMKGLGEHTHPHGHGGHHHHGHHHHHHEHHHHHDHPDHHHDHGHTHHDPDHHPVPDHHPGGHHHHHHPHGQAHPHAHPHEHGHAQRTEGAPGHGHHQEQTGHSPSEGHAHGHEHSHHHGHAHDHEHGHGHDHGHHHTQGPRPGLFQGGAPHLKELLALGFSGGLVPCPAGLVAILLGLQAPEKLLFALGLLVFFSIGLGSVLVAIGVFLVTGKMLVSGAGRHGALFHKAVRVLPIFSSLFIAALGAFFIVRTFTRGRTEIAAMFRLMADWLQ